jgi:hypothetical protein
LGYGREDVGSMGVEGLDAAVEVAKAKELKKSFKNAVE